MSEDIEAVTGPGCPHGSGHRKPTKPGMAWCNGCKRWRKMEQFRREKVPVGIRAQCKECVSTYEREHRHEEKERLVIRGMMLALAAIDDAIEQRASRSVHVPTQTALLKSRAERLAQSHELVKDLEWDLESRCSPAPCRRRTR